MGGQPSVLDKPEASFIKAAVAENCVVVFSKTSCPYCHSTKKLFQDLGVQPQVYELNQRSDGEAIQDVLSEMTGARTVGVSAAVFSAIIILIA